MGEALAAIEPNIIYGEAKRQYEALLHARDAQNSTFSALQADGTAVRSSRIHATRAQQRVDLSQFYHNLWESATVALDEWERHRLLTICLAYKTKARVLCFLDLLEEGAFPWIGSFREIIENYARDTVFGFTSNFEGVMELKSQEQLVQNPLAAFKALYSAKMAIQLHSMWKTITTPSTSYRTRSKAAITKDTAIPQPGPYFVITTLPFAFPGKSFSAFASHAPIDCLTLPHILSHPSALLLAMSAPMSSLLRSNLTNFWNADVHYAQACQNPNEDTSWSEFFEHLSESRAMLTLVDGTPFAIDDGEDGYVEMDLRVWLAGWRAERQSVGIKEKGQEALLRMKLGMRNEAWKDDVEILDSDGEMEKPSVRRKRVSWNESELVAVKEIPGRIIKKRKTRKDW